jgi:hypothetical protein
MSGGRMSASKGIKKQAKEQTGWIGISGSYKGSGRIFMQDKKCPLTIAVGDTNKGFTKLEITLVVPKEHASSIVAGLTKPLTECSADLTMDNILELVEQ